MPPNPRFQWETLVRVDRFAGCMGMSSAIGYNTSEAADYSEWVGQNKVVTPGGMVSVFNECYDKGTGKLLSGTAMEILKGMPQQPVNLLAEKQYSPEDRPNGIMGIEPFWELNLSLKAVGTESISVPAGSFSNARKFEGNFTDGTPITFWVSDRVPVPVKYEIANKYIDGENPIQLYELKNWA